MLAKKVRLSSKHQIAIPKVLRAKLGLEAGTQLFIEEENGRLVLSPRPRSYAAALAGLGKSVWKGVDPLEYIRRERALWDAKR